VSVIANLILYTYKRNFAIEHVLLPLKFLGARTRLTCLPRSPSPTEKPEIRSLDPAFILCAELGRQVYNHS
jgi:hypothetical protein